MLIVDVLVNFYIYETAASGDFRLRMVFVVKSNGKQQGKKGREDSKGKQQS